MTAPGSAQFDYLDGQLRPTHPALFARFATESATSVAEYAPALDLRYGPRPRQTYDLFRARGARRATIAFFHGGYWQARDKADFRFLAPPLAREGFDVALANYPLSPYTPVAEIVAAAMALPAVLDGPLILAGHSAGAQIAVELALASRERGWDVDGVLAISGVFDLEPLVGTTLNDRLGLDQASARAASPIHRIRPEAPPAVFQVGGGETPAFLAQTRAMSAAWAAAGNRAREQVTAGADHFSVLDALGEAVRSL